MKISDNDITALGITPATCVEWVRDSFMMKPLCQCPAKTSIHPQGTDFINTMPALLPTEYHTFGVKIVSRVNGRKPSLRSRLTLYDTKSGELTATMDANWITAMRTGAVAALTMQTLRRTGAKNISMIGLGEMAHASMQCISETFKSENLHVSLWSYKGQAERFAKDFSYLNNVSFDIVDDKRKFMTGAEVVISCVTEADGLIIEDDKLFEPGVLVIPVHTRGFQNCDLTFDKVFGDDTAHIQGFKYFNQFKHFDELSNVLLGRSTGRNNDNERILAYNIGIGIHDTLFGHHIYQILNSTQIHQA